MDSVPKLLGDFGFFFHKKKLLTGHFIWSNAIALLSYTFNATIEHFL